MKKIKKILIWTALVFIVFSASVFVALKIFFTPDKIKAYIIDYAHNELHREVSFDKLSFNMLGFDLENFAMSEKSTFANGTFIKSKRLTVKVNIIPLLRKEITVDTLGIDGMYININRDENGIFNFDDITQSHKQSEETDKKQDSGSLLLNIDNLYVKNSAVKFNDKTTKLNTEVSDFNIKLKGFSFNGLFLCDSSFKIKYKQGGTDIRLPVKIKFETNLNDFDQNKLFLNILSLKTKYNGSDIFINGTAENLNAPEIAFNISVKNVRETTFGDFLKTNIKYSIKSLDLKTNAVINISSKTAVINDLSLVAPQSSASLSGTVNWGGRDLAYAIRSKIDFLLDSLSEVVPQYNLKGRFKTEFAASQNSFDGHIVLENVFSSNPSFGSIENLSAKTHIKAESKKMLLKSFKPFDIDKLNIKINSLNAKYNDADIALNGSWVQDKTSKINLNLRAKNLSDKTINVFYNCKTDFLLPSFSLAAETIFDFKNKSADISQFNIKFPESSALLSGSIDWGKNKFLYKLNYDIDLLLDQMSGHIGNYNLKGRIKSSAKISSEGNLAGVLECLNVSFSYPPLIDVSGLNLKASAKSKNDISVEQMRGMFNTGHFTASASYKGNNLNVKLRMDKLFIKDSPRNNSKNKSAGRQKEKNKNAGSGTNINADIIINEINVPYLISEQAVLNAAVNSVSEKMDKADGTLNLSVTNGKITNVDRLSANKFAKVFLMIFNVLNNNITVSDKVNSKEKGIIYDNMKCILIFTDGLMKAKQVSIKMPLTTISTSGTVNFKSGEVNMRVNTGLYAAMKVSGTLENTKTSFDLVGTAADIIAGSKGTIENVGKKLGKSLQNIFKQQ